MMKLSERICQYARKSPRLAKDGVLALRIESWSSKVAQLESQNAELKRGIRAIIDFHYPVMYDEDKLGIALVALLADTQESG